MEKIEWYFFVLAALLIAAVYYVGVKTDALAFGTVLDNALNVVTGRTTSGVFQGIPKGS